VKSEEVRYKTVPVPVPVLIFIILYDLICISLNRSPGGGAMYQLGVTERIPRGDERGSPKRTIPVNRAPEGSGCFEGIGNSEE